MQIQKLITGFAIFWLFSACSSRPVYDEKVTLPENGWNKDSAIVFKPRIKEAKKPYNIELTVDNNIDYNYQNLWLKYWVVGPEKKAITDSVNIFLVNKNGKWIGDFSGGIHNRHVILRRGVGFANAGQYEFQFIQWMRKKRLQGIKEIGLIIRPVATKDTTRSTSPKQ